MTIARIVAALVVGATLALPAAAQAAAESAPAPAVASAWNTPPASWEEASEIPQYASLPGRETNRLIQGAGREWRELRNGPITRYGGWLLALVPAAILLFYLVKGPIRLRGEPTGRLIERFDGAERAAHWTMAATFVVLAITGVIILFGKYLILPWLGYTGFSWLLVASKSTHNFVGPLFSFSLLISFALYFKDNLVKAIDLEWLANMGGMFGGREVPSGRFNGGEKAWFWGGVVTLGVIVSVTGLLLDFPNWNQGREAMQYANMIHAIAAILFISAAFGHIYLGTVGMKGAYGSMHDGHVDEQWAREHHLLWYEEVMRGERPEKVVVRAAQPAEGDA